jgi:hypothetical protein
MDVTTHTFETRQSTSLKDLLFRNQQFNNKYWREILSQVANLVSDELQIKVDVISPFGFEVSQDNHFLGNTLRRFYCYIAVEKHGKYSKDFIAVRFYETLYQYLSVLNTRLLDDFVAIILNKNIHLLNEPDYHCQQLDKLIDIQVREINHDLLTDYGNYLITSLTGLFEQKIESAHFNKNLRYRWRTYQLYVIQEHLFGYLLPPMTNEEQDMFNSVFPLISNKVNIFYHPEEAYVDASEKEQLILNSLIMSRISQMMIAVMGNSDDTIQISTMAYHFDQILTLNIDHSIYEKALDFIKYTYRNFI